MAKQRSKPATPKDLPFTDHDGILDVRKPNGQFCKGNTAWKAAVIAGTTGRSKAFGSPIELFGHFIEYCESVDGNVWHKVDFRGKDAERVDIPMIMPYTWDGFDNYLFMKGIISNLDDYKSNKEGRYADFADIVTRIGKIITDRKLTGATLNIFNVNIVARELGLADKTETKHTVVNETKIGFE